MPHEMSQCSRGEHDLVLIGETDQYHEGIYWCSCCGGRCTIMIVDDHVMSRSKMQFPTGWAEVERYTQSLKVHDS